MSRAGSIQAAGPAISAALMPERVVREQACYRPISPDGDPVFGAVPGCDGLYIATGKPFFPKSLFYIVVNVSENQIYLYDE